MDYNSPPEPATMDGVRFTNRSISGCKFETLFESHSQNRHAKKPVLKPATLKNRPQNGFQLSSGSRDNGSCEVYERIDLSLQV
jgi:hypothetical protein